MADAIRQVNPAIADMGDLLSEGFETGEPQANARAISAVPDMIEALEGLLTPTSSATWLMGEDRANVLAALAKAKGE